MAAHPLPGLRQFLRGASCEALHRAQGRPDIQAHRDGTKSARNHSGADTGRASAHDSTPAYSRAASAQNASAPVGCVALPKEPSEPGIETPTALSRPEIPAPTVGVRRLALA